MMNQNQKLPSVLRVDAILYSVEARMPRITIGDLMEKYPCDECLVTACCTEVCDNIAKFWDKIYAEYKKGPDHTVQKYGLSEKHAKTLKDLFEAAADNPVSFKAVGTRIRVSIDYSANSPPGSPKVEVVKDANNLTKPVQ